MWLLDKIKSGYKRVVNKLLDVAVRRDYVTLAHFAITLGAEPCPSWREIDGSITYPLLAQCKSEAMIQALVLRSSGSNHYDYKTSMLFAVRNNLFTVVKFFTSRGAIADDYVTITDHSGKSKQILLMNECKSEDMLNLLINKTLEKDIENRTTSLCKCILRISTYSLNEEDHATQIALANKLLNAQVNKNYLTSKTKDTLLHLVAKYKRPIMPDEVFNLFKKIISLQPELINIKNAENMTPLQFFNMGPHARIVDKYASMKGLPANFVPENEENRIFFATNSNKRLFVS